MAELSSGQGLLLLVALLVLLLLALVALLLLATGRAEALRPLLARARDAVAAAAAAAAGGGGGGGAGAGAGEEDLRPMKRRDFTLEQLRRYDGATEPRVLLAVNAKVFDVTSGKRFYGREGPYGAFAGRDASRALASFRMEPDSLREDYDDLADLSGVQMESVREWEFQFLEKYSYVGRLLRPGEEAAEYTDEDDEGRDN